MTKTELIDHSATSLALETQYAYNKPYIPRDTSKHLLYSLNQLPAFRSALQASTDDDKRIAQYIVNPEKTMLIARAGPPGTSVPGHRDMSEGPVLAAGHIFFNATGDVVGLSNESDDFVELSVHSMLWPVLILHLTNTPLATPFIIIPSIIERDGFSTAGEFELTLADRILLTEKLSPNLCKTILEANQQNTKEERLPQQQPQASLSLSKNREIFFPCIKHQQPHHSMPVSLELEYG